MIQKSHARNRTAVDARDLLVVSLGDVGEKKVHPAFTELQQDGCIGKTTFTDVKPKPCFLGPNDNYLRLGPDVPLGQQLRDARVLTDSTLALICSPTEMHVDFALQLAPYCERVAVEKPLSRRVQQAAALAPLANVYPIGHQLFKKPMLETTAMAADGLIPFGEVSKIRFQLLENIGIGDRQVDPITWDTAWHAFELSQAPLYAAGIEFEMVIESSLAGVYFDGDVEPEVSTAARIDGRYLTDVGPIEFEFRLGKGMQAADKSMYLLDAFDNVILSVNLSEGGHAAHRRLMRELLTADEPNMQLNLHQAIEVVKCCERTERLTEPAPAYRFGTTPAWLF